MGVERRSDLGQLPTTTAGQSGSRGLLVIADGHPTFTEYGNTRRGAGYWTGRMHDEEEPLERARPSVPTEFQPGATATMHFLCLHSVACNCLTKKYYLHELFTAFLYSSSL